MLDGGRLCSMIAQETSQVISVTGAYQERSDQGWVCVIGHASKGGCIFF